MKKVLLLLVCVMASMTTMGLKAQDGAKPLSQGQWNHGLAVGAQWIATDLGFAQAEDKVISRTNENYTLDDLRVLYGSKAKWVTYYDKLKAHENEGGDMEKLLATIAGEYEKGAVLKNGVKRDVEKYNASHTGDEVGATPAGEPAPATAQAGNATVVNNADSTAATAQNAQENNAEEKKEDGGHSGHGFLYLLTILGLALGAIGTFLAMQARKENQAIMHDLNDDIKNMQKQLDKMRSTLKGQGEAEHRPHKPASKHDNKFSDAGAAVATKKIDFGEKNAREEKHNERPAEPKRQEPKREEPKKEQPVAVKEEPKNTFGEPRILFMAKPDEDDNFSRSAATYEPGNSIFELTTMDGKSGSFTVINKEEVHKLALLMPGDALTRACSGNDIQSTAGKSRIVTDRAGRAQLENGKWHIVVKATVHYA